MINHILRDIYNKVEEYEPIALIEHQGAMLEEGLTTYGWNSPGRTSLLDECHQNVCTLGLLTRSVLIKIAWFFLRLVRNCHGEEDTKKYQ